MTTKATPAKRGRKPAVKPVAEAAPQKKAKPQIKRRQVDEAFEYEAIRSRGVMMLMQSGITVYDEEQNIVRRLSYRQRFGANIQCKSIYQGGSHKEALK